MNCV